MDEKNLKILRSALKGIGYLSPALAAKMALELFCSPKRYGRPQWEVEPVALGKRRIFQNGLHSVVWGKEDDPIILLAHGWEGRGSQLGKLVEPLLRAGFQVVALDGPAHGESPGRMTNVNFYSIAVQEVVSELKTVHGIVAHSFGAGATGLALTRGMKVSNIVLVAAPSDLSWVIENYCKWMAFSPKVERAFYLRLEKWARTKTSQLNIAKMGESLSVRTLVVHDPEDKEVRFLNAERLSQGWPNAKLLSLKNVGHRRILKSAEFIDAVIQFMKEG